MAKQLLTPHNIFVFIVLLVFSAAWLLGRLDTAIAVPLIGSIGGIGVGASVFGSGLTAGVPLMTSAPAQPAPSEIVHVQAPAMGVSG